MVLLCLRICLGVFFEVLNPGFSGFLIEIGRCLTIGLKSFFWGGQSDSSAELTIDHLFQEKEKIEKTIAS